MYEGLVVVKREGPSQTKKGSTGTIVLTKRRLPNRDIAQNFDEIFQLPFHCAETTHWF